MYSIESLPHTADVRFRLTADTPEEIFIAGLKCMSGLLKENYCETRGRLSGPFRVETRAMDLTSLLIDFLSDVLTRCYNEKILYCQLQILTLDNTGIDAQLYGRACEFFDEDIKAVTYHEAEVFQNDLGKWQTNLIFDV